MPNEDKLLARLKKLHQRRDYHAWRLNEIDSQIRRDTNALASLRGVAFMRPETVKLEIARAEKAAANG